MGKDDMVTNFNGDQRNHIQMYLTSVENTSKPTMFSPSSHSIESDILLFVTFISLKQVPTPISLFMMMHNKTISLDKLKVLSMGLFLQP